MKDKLIIFIINIFSKLPLSLAQRFGWFIGSCLFIFPNKEKHIVRVNLKLCFPKLSEKELNKLVRKSLIENAKTLCEMPRIFTQSGKKSLEKIQKGTNFELFQQYSKSDKGLIILGPHLGNWELTVHFIKKYTDITAMYAPVKQAFLQPIIKKARQNTGAILVPTNIKGVKKQLEVLRAGGVIGILPDQTPKKGNAGEFAEFLGQEAYTMLLANSLAKKTGANVIMLYAQRLGIGEGFVANFVEADSEIANDNCKVAAKSLNKSVENCLNESNIAQYQWTYKRFRKQPNGKQSPYKK